MFIFHIVSSFRMVEGRIICADSPCRNNATCQDNTKEENVTCHCSFGYEGVHCQSTYTYTLAREITYKQSTYYIYEVATNHGRKQLDMGDLSVSVCRLSYHAYVSYQ